MCRAARLTTVIRAVAELRTKNSDLRDESCKCVPPALVVIQQFDFENWGRALAAPPR